VHSNRFPLPAHRRLLGDLRSLIEQARERTARSIDSTLVMLYWEIGQRIRVDILGSKRAAYGDTFVDTLSDTLTSDYGRGFGRRNLFNMIRFAEVFPRRRIVQTLSAQLGWSHFLEVISLADSMQREFYSEMCRIERWSVRTLRRKIASMLFERTAISRKPAKLARRELAALRDEDRLTPDLVFRDPYVLDFLKLQDSFSERDLEAAILRDIESFVLELGVGFTFVARQKRITVDGEDYYLDLLFFHRALRRLVVVELKLDRFKPADAGQMLLYLRWLDRHERKPGEESPIGLILCAGKSAEHVELLRLGRSRIRVAEYLTRVLPRDLLAKKLRESLRLARARFERGAGEVREASGDFEATVPGGGKPWGEETRSHSSAVSRCLRTRRHLQNGRRR
jgi:predicted nuclease of restriction endonuclease-like (RecB) superfamily